MRVLLGEDIALQFGEVGHGAVEREGDGLVDLALDRRFDARRAPLRPRPLSISQLRKRGTGSRAIAASFSPWCHVRVRVAEHVAVEAEGLGFDQRRTFAGAGALDGLARRRVHRERIVAVDRDAGHLVADGAVGDLLRPRSPARSACARHSRCSGRRRSTGSFHTAAMFSASWKAPMLRGAVAEVGDGHALLAADLRRQRQAVGDRHAAADDAGRDHHAATSGWVTCIGPPLPLQVPVALPAISAHSSFERHALGEHVVDAAVDRADVVRRS